MAVLVTMPKMSQTTDEVVLLRWKVHVGDLVSRGEPLCEVETDKTSMDVESFETGTVLELRATEAETVVAGAVIAVIGAPGESAPAPGPGGAEVSPTRGEQAGTRPPEATPRGAPGEGRAAEDGIRATPLVRHIAARRGVDLSRIQGSGARGLITKGDVEAYLAARSAAGETDRVLPLTEGQRIVGRSLSRWWTTAPHYYLRLDVTVDRLLVRRRSLRRPDGSLVSLNAFLLQAVARALALHPRVNSTLGEGELREHGSVNVGLAVAAGEDLYVPVVRNADRMDLVELDRELARLVDRVRRGDLRPSDLAGGTFTVTNLGMEGIDEFSPIIAPGQTGILAVGRIRRSLEVGEGDSMAIRSVCVLTAAFDHRVVNGAQAARFLAAVRREIEERKEGEHA